MRPGELKQYKLLVDSIIDYAIYMLDENGVVISWNAGAARAKGYTQQEILGQNFSVFYSADDQADGLPARSLETARREGRLESQGWRYRKDGSRFWALVVIDSMFEDGRFIGFAKVTRDASVLHAARIELEAALAAAEAANQAKSNFLAVMSHEIRTPLNGVLGMAQAMAAGDLSKVQRGRLNVIRESGESLLAVLNDILDLSKIEAGHLDLEEVDFDLGEISRGAYAAFTAIANDKGLSFRLEINGAAGVYRGDPTRLRQILYNIISNALKFTIVGEVAVTAARTESGLRLKVQDTGIGMSEETIEKVFSPFSQADASTTRKFGGTGLGLAICKKLADMMGGSISVASVIGEGSTFTIDLPLVHVGPPGKAREITQPTSPTLLPDVAMRVLGAEDNFTNQLVLRTLLNQVGIDPVMVDNGEEAVAAWTRETWDLVLMDVQMPVMDGVTATVEIRRREAAEGRPRTPIYALSANAMPHQVSTYVEAGMDGHIAKPLQVAELFAVLEVGSAALANEEIAG